MELLNTIVEEWLWGIPLIVVLLSTGVLLTLASGLFQFRFFNHCLRQFFKKTFNRDNAEVRNDVRLSPFEALSVAVGSTVGVGNIAGVATAIATGGPGAIFWMWIAGLLGQIIKMTEVSLAVHYRSRDKDDKTFGGPTYYIAKGIGIKRGAPLLSKFMNFFFLCGFVVSFFLTMQNYTVSEAIAGTFQLDLLTVSIVYTILIYFMISGGLKGLGRIAIKLVPFMCLFFLLGGLFIIFKNYQNIPGAFGLIFDGAFNGTAAVGGFGGAAFARIVKLGMARAVYSNEAGWGTSPMIHASVRTDHPIRQGLLGVFEVFFDTIIVCSIVALTIITTGQWSSGAAGATLSLNAFQSELGIIGRIILTAGILLFGLTTSSGFYAQVEVLVRYLIGESKNKARILTLFKWFYPIPSFLLVFFAVSLKMPTTHVWLFADMGSAIPIFVNVVALAILYPDFIELLKDYKARHLGIGYISPSTRIFFDDGDKSQNVRAATKN